MSGVFAIFDNNNLHWSGVQQLQDHIMWLVPGASSLQYT